MKVKIAKNAGFCFGVRRAIKIVYEELEKSKGEPVYTLGPIVHNPQVIKDLEQDGVRSIENLVKQDKGRLIIRSHGVSPKIKNEAIRLGYTVIDATCPLVKKIHDIVINLKKDNYPIIVIGHASHPEVKGIVGEVESGCKVIEKKEEINNISYSDKIGVVVQTTALWSKFIGISMEILKKTREARIYNTICNATMERQSSTGELAEKADVMIVVGGNNSSNTRRLLEISLQYNPRAYHVEYPHDIKDEWFINANFVGLTAGASTPDSIISRVRERIENIR